jgi:hypothetical protein
MGGPWKVTVGTLGCATSLLDAPSNIGCLIFPSVEDLHLNRHIY